MSTIEVKVPDIGDFKDIPVIEVLVKPGDSVKAEDSLVTLESDKATMDVPSPSAGTVKELKVKVGDKVSEGTLILTLDSAAGASEAVAKPASPTASAPPPQTSPTAAAERAPRGEKGLADTPGEGPTPTPPEGKSVEVRVPDIGDFSDVPVIEIFVKPGDVVKVDDPLVTLESDKATMDVPSPVAGAVQGVRVSVGDRVSEGSVIATVASAGAPAPAPSPQPCSRKRERELGSVGALTPTCFGRRERERASSTSNLPSPRKGSRAGGVGGEGSGSVQSRTCVAIGAQVRTRARRRLVEGQGHRSERPHPARGRARLRETGTRSTFTGRCTRPGGAIAGGGTLNLLPWPKVDFAKFGPVETKPLSRIKKISGRTSRATG